MGDFNYINLAETCCGFYQHFTSATSQINAKPTEQQPVPWTLQSYLFCLSLYTSLCIKPTQQTITVRPYNAASVLQDCVACTYWQIFKTAATNAGKVDLKKYASAITSYIMNCVDDVTSIRAITIHPNQMLWRKLVRSLLRSGNAVALRATQSNK